MNVKCDLKALQENRCGIRVNLTDDPKVNNSTIPTAYAKETQDFYFTMGPRHENLIKGMMWKGQAVDAETQAEWIAPILDKERGVHVFSWVFDMKMH